MLPWDFGTRSTGNPGPGTLKELSLLFKSTVAVRIININNDVSSSIKKT